MTRHDPNTASCLQNPTLIRGGSYADDQINGRSTGAWPSLRPIACHNIGFRVALSVEAVKSAKQESPAVTQQEPLPPTFKNSIGMEFVIVPKGKSWLGGGKDKLGDKEVEIPADFYLGKYEVTQEEWEKVMGENPSHFSRNGRAARTR